MTPTRNGKDERMFSIELRSKEDVKKACLDGDEKVLIEGSLGSLIRAQFLEDLVLEVIGSHGELRVDLAANELHLRKLENVRSNKDGGTGQ